MRGKHHVAADQQLQRLAVQRDVLGRVAVADVADPLACRRCVSSGRRRAGAGSWPAPAAPGSRSSSCAPRPVRPRPGRRGRARHEVGGAAAAEAGRRAAGEPGGVVVGRADPQPHAPAFGQPVRQPHVVGVHVRDDHAQHRQAVEFVREHLLPRGAGRVVADAAVDDGPALDRPSGPSWRSRSSHRLMWLSWNGSVHAQPAHARRDLERRADLGQRVAERVVQREFVRVHRSLHQDAFTLYVNVNSECKTPCLQPLLPTRMPADLHDRRAGARVRSDDARDPLLRGLRAAAAAARRPQPRLHRARPHPPEADLRGKRLGLKLARGQGAGRHVRVAARHPAAAEEVPAGAGRAPRASSSSSWPTSASRSTRCGRTSRRRSGCWPTASAGASAPPDVRSDAASVLRCRRCRICAAAAARAPIDLKEERDDRPARPGPPTRRRHRCAARRGARLRAGRDRAARGRDRPQRPLPDGPVAQDGRARRARHHRRRGVRRRRPRLPRAHGRDGGDLARVGARSASRTARTATCA